MLEGCSRTSEDLDFVKEGEKRKFEISQGDLSEPTFTPLVTPRSYFREVVLCFLQWPYPNET